jgi:hypothetical protein
MRRRDLLAFALASTPALRGPVLAAGRTPLAVIVGETTPLDALSADVLRSAFLGEPVKDRSGNKLVPLNQAPGSIDRVEFDRTVLQMSPDENGRYWIDRRIRGQGQPPRICPSVPLLLKLVARFPGALSYVRLDRVEPGVRVLRIDGKLPKDKGYLLA